MATKIEMVEAIVARGKTIRVGQGRTEVSDADGKIVGFPKPAKSYTAGEKITLPADEAVWLRKTGFLVDPKAEVIEVGNGPQFSPSDGPTIQAGMTSI
jgi:hypothetical protein